LLTFTLHEIIWDIINLVADNEKSRRLSVLSVSFWKQKRQRDFSIDWDDTG